MPDYQIQAPDGNTYKISGPPNASKDEIIQHVLAKNPQAAKPKATSGPKGLGLADKLGAVVSNSPLQMLPPLEKAGRIAVKATVGKPGRDVAEALLSPKEVIREAYHTVTDWAADTMKAVDDLSDWIGDFDRSHGGSLERHIDSKGIRLPTKAEAHDHHIDETIEKALKGEAVIRQPQTVTGGLIKDFGEFTLGMLSAGRTFKIANETLKGGVSAFTVFDPQQQKLSDLMAKYPQLKNPVTTWLQTKPNDSPILGRVKNTIEGVLGGKATDAFLKSLDLLRAGMKGKVAAEAFQRAAEDKPHFTYAGVDPKTGKIKVKLAAQQGEMEAKVDMAAQAAAGKRPDMGEGISNSAGEVATEVAGQKPKTPSMSLEQAFSPVPPVERAKAKLGEWYKSTVQFFAPEATSATARQAGADIASAFAEQQQHIEERFRRSPERKEYFDTNAKKIPGFVSNFEKGTPMGDPVLENARQFYKTWMSKLEAKEKSYGVQYDPVTHYLPHLFENEAGVQAWMKSEGLKNPGFTKERSFALYEQAAKAGFRPRYTNPEDIFQARQHESDIAIARIQAMRSLEEDGSAYQGESGRPGFSTSYNSPDGKTYWVHDDAKHLLNKMFDDKSLWTDRSVLGSLYRGAVTLKNNVVPIRLAFSLFHPLHVLTMHLGAATWTRSWKAGELIPSHYSEGSRTLQILRGKIPASELTEHDQQALQYLADGGLILEQDPRYRTQALERLRTEFVKASPGALLHLHTGALQAIQNVIFKNWIPSLKGASYLADVRAALKAKPDLLDNDAARRVALRRIAKSVENRYGEMNYSTLFWNRLFRDSSVLSMTSMGWALGMFREYGGGAGQLTKAVARMGKAIATDPQTAQKVYSEMKKSGDMDKLFYVSSYTMLTATMSGLVTWALTGKRPQEVMDFFAPKNGETNPDGSPSRIRTMFYTYEAGAMAKLVKNKGPFQAAEDWAAGKGSGLPTMLREIWKGVDGLDRQVRDPSHPVYQQIKETLDALMKENTPISMQNKSGAPESQRQKVLNFAGMTKAPKYLQETSGEAQIETLWEKQYKTGETPYQQSTKSADRQQLQAAVQAKDDAAVDKILPAMVEKYHLRSQDAKRIMKDAALGLTSYQALFREMRADDQRAILKKLPPAERAKYIAYAKREVQAEYSE